MKIEIFTKEGDLAPELMADLIEQGHEASYWETGRETPLDILIFCPELTRMSEVTALDQIESTVLSEVQRMQNCFDECLDRLRDGEKKRIAFLSSPEVSISNSVRKEIDASRFFLVGEGMFAKMLFNNFRAEGFTFRCFAPTEGGVSAATYILQDFCYDPNEPESHSEENRLVLRNSRFEEVPW